MLARFRYIIKDILSIGRATVLFVLGDFDLAPNFSLQGKKMPPLIFLLLWPLHVARASTNEGGEKEACIKRRLECFLPRGRGGYGSTRDRS